MFARVVNPARKLFPGRDGASRIIWKTEIHKIDMLLGRLGNESILGRARQVNDPLVAAIRFCRAAVARHHIRVDIDRINRIGDGHLVLVTENIEDITAIAF